MSLVEQILKNINSAVIMIDLSSITIVEANSRAFDLLMYDNYSEKIKLEDLFVDQLESGQVVFNKDKLQYDNFYHEIFIKTKDGNVIVAELDVKIIDFESKKYALLTFRDVTFDVKLKRDVEFKQEELMTALDEINKQNSELKTLDKAKDKFLALVTHELRTPLSAIVATADVLHNKYYEPEQLDELIAMVHSEGKHLMEIVNDILDFSRIQTGKMDLYLEKQTPCKIISDQLNYFEAMAKEKNITLEVNSNEGFECYFDPLRLTQIVSNIISNGIKFNKPDGKLTVSFKEDSDKVTILFKDEGLGIPKGKEASVFNEFETLESIKTHHKGTGLGMPISKKLVEAMGGKIYFESEHKVGTIFYIDLPNQKILASELYRSRPDENADLLAS